jgi:hypothetical protein
MMPASISRKVLSPALTLFALAGCSSYLAAAKIPVNLSDNIVTCGATTRCSNKKMFGRTYKVIDTARFTVMVSISNEGRYTRADVSIANHAGYSQNISPEDFRVEVVSPKAKVLEYVPPAELQNMAALEPAAVPARAVTGSAGQSAVAQSLAAESVSVVVLARAARAEEIAAGKEVNPNIDELYETAQKEAVLKEAVEKEAAQKHLAAAAIPANDVVRGRVYFRRDPKAKQVNVVLPLSGQVFEFPYLLTK